MKKQTTILLVLITGLSLVTCSNPFAPPRAGPGSLAPIFPQNCSDCPDSVNAYNVLANFKYAYENNDLDIYENCLDREFIFIYVDQDQQGNIETIEIPRDGISGDIYRTRGLFAAFNEIRLDTWLPARLAPDSSEFHNGEIWERWLVNFHLSLRDLSGAYDYQQYEALGLALFKIRKSADGYWRIVVWEDYSFTS